MSKTTCPMNHKAGVAPLNCPACHGSGVVTDSGTGEAFNGVVTDSGGGMVHILVDRDTHSYPKEGQAVTVSDLTPPDELIDILIDHHVDFKMLDQLYEAITRLYADREAAARVDEVQQMDYAYHSLFDDEAGLKAMFKHIQARLASLREGGAK